MHRASKTSFSELASHNLSYKLMTHLVACPYWTTTNCISTSFTDYCVYATPEEHSNYPLPAVVKVEPNEAV